MKSACHERGLLQALRRYGSGEEWNCAWLSTLSMPLVRLQFHNDAAAGQAACDEGAGLASLRHGQPTSFGSIARILGVSDVAVLNWVRDQARKLPRPSTKAEVVVVTLDEMWHFVKKKLRNCGFGKPMTLLLGEPSPGFLVSVMTPHAKSSSPKSALTARRSSPMIGRAITASSLMTNSSPAKT